MPAAARPRSLGAPRTGAHQLFQQSEGEARWRRRHRRLESRAQILVPPVRVLDGLFWVLCVSGFRFSRGGAGHGGTRGSVQRHLATLLGPAGARVTRKPAPSSDPVAQMSIAKELQNFCGVAEELCQENRQSISKDAENLSKHSTSARPLGRSLSSGCLSVCLHPSYLSPPVKNLDHPKCILIIPTICHF